MYLCMTYLYNTYIYNMYYCLSSQIGCGLRVRCLFGGDVDRKRLDVGGCGGQGCLELEPERGIP